jgi:hypothetical protein
MSRKSRQDRQRRRLREIPLAEDLRLAQPGRCTMTMSVGQWDTWLEVAYDQGFVLLELDDNEVPVAAYQRQAPEVN